MSGLRLLQLNSKAIVFVGSGQTGACAPSDLPWRPSPCQAWSLELDSLGQYSGVSDHHLGGVDGGCRLWSQYQGPVGAIPR